MFCTIEEVCNYDCSKMMSTDVCVCMYHSGHGIVGCIAFFFQI